MNKQLRSKILRGFREGVKEFNLITPSDVILIGLSGGKDSLALLDLMGDMQRISDANPEEIENLVNNSYVPENATR